MMKNAVTDSSSTTQSDKQYSLKKIVLIWALSALPMGILAFIITPMLIQIINLPPAIIYWISIIIGLIWQFILSLIILKREGCSLNWSAIRKRTKYQKPVNPKTGRASYWLLLWVVPFIILNGLLQTGIGLPDVDGIIAPLLKNLPKYDLTKLASADYKGAWWILGLYLITMIFNYFLGEEFIYRGILLPKMKGVFGKLDWFANGVLFGLYHLHKPQIIVSTALLFGFLFAFPARYFQSSWMSLIIHVTEGLLGLVVVLMLILGISQ